MKLTKKTIEKNRGSSFRDAGNVSASLQIGIFAYLDNELAPQTASHKNAIFTHFGTAGANYSAICMVHSSGNNYGGIAFSYEGTVVKFTRQENIYTIEYICNPG